MLYRCDFEMIYVGYYETYIIRFILVSKVFVDFQSLTLLRFSSTHRRKINRFPTQKRLKNRLKNEQKCDKK